MNGVSSLPGLTLRQEPSFWCWQRCSDRPYTISRSAFPHLHTPLPLFSPVSVRPNSGLIVSVGVKHHIYLFIFVSWQNGREREERELRRTRPAQNSGENDDTGICIASTGLHSVCVCVWGGGGGGSQAASQYTLVLRCSRRFRFSEGAEWVTWFSEVHSWKTISKRGTRKGYACFE